MAGEIRQFLSRNNIIFGHAQVEALSAGCCFLMKKELEYFANALESLESPSSNSWSS